jgi:hypothetical protein
LGLLDPTVAAARLLNLGWTNPDVVLLLADARGKLATMQARAVAAADRAKAKQLKELTQLNKAHAKAISDNVAHLRRLFPQRQLKKWLTEGIASEDWVGARLAEQQYPAEVIGALIADWTREKGQAPGPQLLPPPLPPPPPVAPPAPVHTTIQPTTGGTIPATAITVIPGGTNATIPPINP